MVREREWGGKKEGDLVKGWLQANEVAKAMNYIIENYYKMDVQLDLKLIVERFTIDWVEEVEDEMLLQFADLVFLSLLLDYGIDLRLHRREYKEAHQHTI